MSKKFTPFLLLLILILLITENSKAQFKLGASLGLNNSTFGGVPPEDATYSSIYGFNGSLLIEMKLVNDVYLSLQPGYQTSGSDINFGNENNIFDDTVKTYKIGLAYFNIPLNIKIYYKNLYVGGGLAVGLLTSATFTDEYLDGVSDIDIKEKFKSFDLLSNFNVGYKVSLGKPDLFFEFRYIQGLININDQNSYGSSDNYLSNFKNKGFSLITGILYPL